ncbi:SDR family NAD(P)-dependent oxidoreductase [Paenibacillus sp. AR247]|uniref:SDR family NAD(P)-dependent oxidoreductase n=1 Tax=Paenibacillus sp. AR247 TaxID=1631599 RepID=UPI000CFA5369|nr:SDR family NAD(P)-dependent oxidoreductase [Paenibacillus sp. AR247]PQP86453.1 dehydrogenase [Paenibacillus sp. AR247]
MQDKPVALVTGANKGIGLQIAKDLAAHGFTVLVGSRSLKNGEEAAKSVGPDARALQLDVTNQVSVDAAAERIRRELGRLDVLVNNAGISHAGKPLLRKAPAARIVNVSSEAGSLTLNADPANPHRPMFGAVYSPSKTALNAVTLAFAIELESTGIKVNAACPGFTGTDLNNFAGTRTVEQGAREPVRLALLDENGPTGTFSNEDGPLPW